MRKPQNEQVKRKDVHLLPALFAVYLEGMRVDQEALRKSRYLLSLCIFAFLLIFLRISYLTTIKQSDYLQHARNPQQRKVIEPAKRGTIYDRFGIPLAINKIQYNCTIIYHDIQSDFPKRKDRIKHVEELASFLSTILPIHRIEIEDLIYSKAAIFPHTPFPICKDLSESTYYFLHAAEKKWSGLQMDRSIKRFYPQGKVAADSIGYLGSINSNQYQAIANELDVLRQYLTDFNTELPSPLPKGFVSIHEVEKRYNELLEKAYTIWDQVGKMGVECTREEQLRGVFGKYYLEVDAKGKVIERINGGKHPISGDSLTLTLSAELQKFAEKLLIQSEQERDAAFPLAGKNHASFSSPWIKGGAIVAMIPNTGEVVALASYPRFNPNDFLLNGSDTQRKEKSSKIRNWLENKQYRGELWDGIRPLKRERLSPGKKEIIDEYQVVTWDFYLQHILSNKSQVKKAILSLNTLNEAIDLLFSVEEMLRLSKQSNMALLIDALYPQGTNKAIKQEAIELQILLKRNPDSLCRRQSTLDPFLLPITHNADKLLFFDLLRLVIDPTLFPENLQSSIGHHNLSYYRQLTQAFLNTKKEIHQIVKKLYHSHIFPQWREKKFSSYLKQKREEEKKRHTYARPYTDYLTKIEKELFDLFWEDHYWKFIEAYLFQEVAVEKPLQAICFQILLQSRNATKKPVLFLRKALSSLDPKIRLTYLRTMRSFSDLHQSLWGNYSLLHSYSKKQTLRDLATAFYPKYGFGYGKSYAYAQAAAPGSLFKIVTGYEALCQIYKQQSSSLATYPDLNPLLLYDEPNPYQRTEKGIVLGRNAQGKWISRQYKGGRLPRSHTAMGKIDFETAMERSSNLYFSILAGDVISSPSELESAAKYFGLGKRTGIELTGEVCGNVPDDLNENRTGLYACAIGQHSLTSTPLQMALLLSTLANPKGITIPPHILKRNSSFSPYLNNAGNPFPLEVRKKLLDSLYRAVWGEHGNANPRRIRSLYQKQSWMRDYRSLYGQFIGKTSTAEFAYRPTLDREGKTILCKDIWFGAIAFNESLSTPLPLRKAELVVIVYLRFGDYGKEAAPIAAKIIKKWREIKEKNCHSIVD